MSPMSEDDSVHDALSDELARLTGNARFTVAEFGANGATVVRVYRDGNGTPQAEQPRLSSSAMAGPDAFYREVAPLFIAQTSPHLPDELRELLSGLGGVPVYHCRTSLRDHVFAAMGDSLLTLGYELAVLKRVPPGRSGAGNLYLSGHQLFPPGMAQGHKVTVKVRCEPTDGDGTVFAVVTREPAPDVPMISRNLQAVQVQSAVVAPGSYDLEAVLIRPGKVQFKGLPAALGRCDTPWDVLRYRVPAELAAPEPVHLVCLIEVSGGEQRVQSRIDRLVQLISAAETGARQLLVSVVAYGPHAVAWAIPDEPIEVRAWAVPGAQAIDQLRGSIGRAEDEREYTGAAQLECALQEVARRQPERAGQPVIVTAGGRQAHPPGMDTRTQIIPCPYRVSWRTEFQRLDRVPGTAFGALRDGGARSDVWQALGRDATSAVDVADMGDFAAALGLRQVAQAVTFPFIEE
jgi:hypothetical protein